MKFACANNQIVKSVAIKIRSIQQQSKYQKERIINKMIQSEEKMYDELKKAGIFPAIITSTRQNEASNDPMKIIEKKGSDCLIASPEDH